MKIITSLRVKEEKQNDLKQKFNEVAFDFFPSMTEAESELSNANILITYGEDLTPELIKKAP